MERLGLGPDALSSTNSALVYGRLTGWGQSGPLSQAAGHDINYLSLSGANWYSGASGETHTPPPTLAGDVGGGALYLTVGLLAGIMRARETGKGCVVDAAIVDGAAHMTSLLLSLRAGGGLPEMRGSSMLDGAPFYGVYMCADERAISIGPLEPKFYIELLQRLELENDPDCLAQFDQSKWAATRRKISSVFQSKPMAHWRKLLEGTDVCFAPVLSPSEAAEHPHLKARRTYLDIDGILQAAAAPRFDGEAPIDPRPTPKKDAHREELLRAFVDKQNG
jgi:acetyl-CoA hydrolase